MSANQKIDELCVNTIKLLSAEGVQKANSGHPGMPMGMAAVAYTLWTKHLKHNPANPKWQDRDRFVLSAGHGSILLYSLLYLTGYDLSLDDLKNFRQWGSKTPGHPESSELPGVEATTGPLGQGTANAVGMAMTERWLAGTYNKPGQEIVDHYTYTLVSDGDLMEGISAEAASLAGHLKLGKLIYLYDDNSITIDGKTNITFTEDVMKRYEAYGWHTQTVDGMDITAVDAAINKAKAVTDKPSIIACKTLIGAGSPNMSGTSKVHGSPLGKDELKLTKEALGFPADKDFYVPEEALAQFRLALDNGKKLEEAWNAKYKSYAASNPELAKQWATSWSNQLPNGWKNNLPVFKSEDGGVATRSAFGKALNAVAVTVPWLVGGSADLEASTDTKIKDGSSFQSDNYAGTMIRFGIREHAMGAVLNGMCYHGGVKPYGSTFFVFSDYMRPSARIAAIAELSPIYVWTHDSIGVGEDGPTHQPVEHLASLRIIPNMTTIRPSDANETALAVAMAVENQGGPVALILSRQKLNVIDRTKYAPAEGALKGGYVLAGDVDETPDVILIATGSEVSLALDAYEKLKTDGVNARVVALPSWEVFRKQSKEYQKKVLPPTVKARVSIEAGSSMGWRDWVGDNGIVIGVDKFGASAPAEKIFAEYGFSVENICAQVTNTLNNVKQPVG